MVLKLIFDFTVEIIKEQKFYDELGLCIPSNPSVVVGTSMSTKIREELN